MPTYNIEYDYRPTRAIWNKEITANSVVDAVARFIKLNPSPAIKIRKVTQVPEQILVIPEERMSVLGDATGFIKGDAGTLAHLLDPSHMQFLERTDELEANPSFKQLIPYMILMFRAEGEWMIFQYTRMKAQGEKRLHGKKSIGIGGHVNPSDLADANTHPLFGGARRELNEEVDIHTAYRTFEHAGLLYDPSNDVGKVHLGIVMHVRLNAPCVLAKEDSMGFPGFLKLSQLVEFKDQFENWSQLCIEHLAKELPSCA